jgi:predicted nucleic acid-binding Zn ribbon protein
MKKPRRTHPIPLARIVPKVLGELGFDQTALILRITRRWGEVVGAEASRHSRPDMLRAGVLEVLVDSSVWSQELQVQRPRIMGELRRLFGEDAPKELRLRLGSPAIDSKG